MEVYNDLDNIRLKNTAIAIGMFDGFHLGHMKIIDELKKTGLTTCIFSLNIANSKDLKWKKLKIITDNKKYKILHDLNINYYIYPKFSKVKNMLANDFIESVLINRFDAKVVVCGEDFRFGYNRVGDVSLLEIVLKKWKVDLHIIKSKLVNEERISSSAIRKYIEMGDIIKANTLLGRNLSLDFEVVKYIDKCIIQKLDFKYSLPPNGEYLSVISDKNKKVNTRTIIYDENNFRFAKTICRSDMLESIKDINLIDKIK